FTSYLLAGTRGASEARPEGESGWHGPADVPHVLLAACRADETAKEVEFGGAPGGIFTNYLLATLENAGDATTYQDLYKQTQALVLAHALEQTPQFEALDPDELRRPFLGGALRPPAAYYTVRYDRLLGWVMDGGAVHGIVPPSGDETTTVALFPMTAGPDELRLVAARVGQGRVTEVQPHLSRLALEMAQPPDTSATYKALVIGLPLPRFTVTLEGMCVRSMCVRSMYMRPPGSRNCGCWRRTASISLPGPKMGVRWWGRSPAIRPPRPSRRSTGWSISRAGPRRRSCATRPAASQAMLSILAW
ncbi:MAG: hypothetical protein DCC57_16655, partial [Chloroflexi bacterium]